MPQLSVSTSLGGTRDLVIGTEHLLLTCFKGGDEECVLYEIELAALLSLLDNNNVGVFSINVCASCGETAENLTLLQPLTFVLLSKEKKP